MFDEPRKRKVKDEALKLSKYIRSRFVTDSIIITPQKTLLYKGLYHEFDLVTPINSNKLHYFHEIKHNDLQNYKPVGFGIETQGVSAAFGTFLSKRLIIEGDTLYCGSVTDVKTSTMVDFSIVSAVYKAEKDKYLYTLKFNSKLPELRPTFWILGNSFVEYDITFSQNKIFLLDTVLKDVNTYIIGVNDNDITTLYEKLEESAILPGDMNDREIFHNHKPTQGFLQYIHPNTVMSEDSAFGISFGKNIKTKFVSSISPVEGYEGQAIEFIIYDNDNNEVLYLTEANFTNDITFLTDDIDSDALTFRNVKVPIKLHTLRVRENFRVKKLRFVFNERGFLLTPIYLKPVFNDIPRMSFKNIYGSLY